jgi:hypothetical protein
MTLVTPPSDLLQGPSVARSLSLPSVSCRLEAAHAASGAAADAFVRSSSSYSELVGPLSPRVIAIDSSLPVVAEEVLEAEADGAAVAVDGAPTQPVENPASTSRAPTPPTFFSSLAKVIRLACRYFGGHRFSIPGLLLRIVTLQVLLDWVRYGSLKRALFGVPLSKTTYAGDHPTREQLESLKTAARFSSLTAAVHGQCGEWIREAQEHGFEPLNPKSLGIPLGVGELATETCIYDPKTGLKTMLFREASTNRLMVVFGALGSLGETPVEFADELREDHARRVQMPDGKPHNSTTHYYAVGQNLLGIRPALHLQAGDLMGRIQAHLPGETLHCVGQCLGGSLATFCALKYGATATTFNSLALGAGLQAELTQSQLERAVDDIQVYSAYSDFISNPHRAVWGAGKAVNLLGIRTPIVLGNQLVIPTAYTKRQETHDYITGSLAAYLSRDLPPQQDGIIDLHRAKRMKPSEILKRFDPPADASNAVA